MKTTTFYQLWCFYEGFYEDLNIWKMEGFFRTTKEAKDYLTQLRDQVETLYMPDWLILQV